MAIDYAIDLTGHRVRIATLDCLLACAKDSGEYGRFACAVVSNKDGHLRVEVNCTVLEAAVITQL